MPLRSFFCLFALLSSTTYGDTIAVIGTGSVGAALGSEFGAQGHTIVYGSRNPSKKELVALVARSGDDASVATPTEAVKDADLVVLAVPGLMVEQITIGLGDLSGKIIIDPTNALIESDQGLVMGVETSNGQLIQAIAPGAHVVKAFNTLNWEQMVDPESSGGPISIPLAGNSDLAKAKVASLVEAMGLEAIDVGTIESAHWIEGMLILWINNRYTSERPVFEYHLRKN